MINVHHYHNEAQWCKYVLVSTKTGKSILVLTPEDVSRTSKQISQEIYKYGDTMEIGNYICRYKDFKQIHPEFFI